MKKMIAMVFLSVIGIQVVYADFNNGVVAYASGDYEMAFNTMRSLSETTDHPLAQYYLGMMYLRGQGPEQDYDEASKWFRRAAKQGIPQAQYRLGELYINGQGVPQDYEVAYAWFKVATAHQHKKALNMVSPTQNKLSTAELHEAEKLAQSFIEKYGPKQEDKAGQ